MMGKITISIHGYLVLISVHIDYTLIAISFYDFIIIWQFVF